MESSVRIPNIWKVIIQPCSKRPTCDDQRFRRWVVGQVDSKQLELYRSQGRLKIYGIDMSKMVKMGGWIGFFKLRRNKFSAPNVEDVVGSPKDLRFQTNPPDLPPEQFPKTGNQLFHLYTTLSSGGGSGLQELWLYQLYPCSQPLPNGEPVGVKLTEFQGSSPQNSSHFSRLIHGQTKKGKRSWDKHQLSHGTPFSPHYSTQNKKQIHRYVISGMMPHY